MSRITALGNACDFFFSGKKREMKNGQPVKIFFVFLLTASFSSDGCRPRRVDLIFPLPPMFWIFLSPPLLPPCPGKLPPLSAKEYPAAVYF